MLNAHPGIVVAAFDRLQHRRGRVFGVQGREQQDLARSFFSHAGARRPLPQLGEDSPCFFFEIRQCPGVIDDILTLRPLALGGHLGGDHAVGVLVRQPPQRAQPCAAERDGRVDQDHGIELRWIHDFEQQRDVVDDDGVTPLARRLLQLEPALLDGGVNDRIECREGRVVAHDLGAQSRAVERAIPAQHVGPEAARNRRQHGAAGRLGFAGERVGVDDGGAPFLEKVNDRRFARRDVAGERDVKHGNYFGLRISD